MVVLLIIFISIFVYGIAFGLASKMFYYKVAKPHFRYESDEIVASFFAGLFWPVSLPALLTVRDPRKGARMSRDDRRRNKELAEARHLSELAKIRAVEAVNIEKALEANLKSNPLNV